jgi:hypothetical protein
MPRLISQTNTVARHPFLGTRLAFARIWDNEMTLAIFVRLMGSPQMRPRTFFISRLSHRSRQLLPERRAF